MHFATINTTNFWDKGRQSGGKLTLDVTHFSTYSGLGLSDLEAEIDIKPDTLNLKSNGNWITTYIELPYGNDASEIDASTVLLEGIIPAVTDTKYDFVTDASEYLIDNDGDGTLERLVKFDRAEVQSLLISETAKLSVTGVLSNGKPFEGSDTIKVIDNGNNKDVTLRIDKKVKKEASRTKVSQD